MMDRVPMFLNVRHLASASLSTCSCAAASPSHSPSLTLLPSSLLALLSTTNSMLPRFRMAATRRKMDDFSSLVMPSTSMALSSSSKSCSSLMFSTVVTPDWFR